MPTPRVHKFLNMPGALKPRPGHDPILAEMKSRGIPVTRENYIAMAHPGADPTDYPVELEMELPVELRLWKDPEQNS